jgi:alkanesulfonate monooxygenase SsuD/methylene tetrahydromethanopterin reductase-like flavin-dependent oxidoreductase (luciferase family)
MKFHWFARDVTNIRLDLLQKELSYWNDCGYRSVLEIYNSNYPDMFIKSARVLNTSEKIKINVAIRTMSISPEYCAMMSAAFNEIQKDRLILNILPGALSVSENYDSIIDPTNTLDSREKILDHTELFLDILTKHPLFIKHRPEIACSGAAPETVNFATKYADYLIVDYQRIMERGPDHAKIFRKAGRVIMQLDVVVTESAEERDKFLRDLWTPKDPKLAASLHNKNLIVASQSELHDKLQEFKELYGVEDFMFAHHWNASEHKNNIHSFVEKYS